MRHTRPIRHIGPTKTNRRGLTLLELVIVLAVLAVLASLAAPGMGERLRAQRLHSAAEALVLDIAHARDDAARRGDALHIEARLGRQQWCWSVSTQAQCNCGANSGTAAGDSPGAALGPAPAAAPAVAEGGAAPASCRLKNVVAAEFPGIGLERAAPVRIGADGVASEALAAVFVSGERKLQVHVSRFGRGWVCDPLGVSQRVPRC
jgi:type IV fimbrial biogenesis protein FimT